MKIGQEIEVNIGSKCFVAFVEEEGVNAVRVYIPDLDEYLTIENWQIAA